MEVLDIRERERERERERRRVGTLFFKNINKMLKTKHFKEFYKISTHPVNFLNMNSIKDFLQKCYKVTRQVLKRIFLHK
jgi:hypothetical protein